MQHPNHLTIKQFLSNLILKNSLHSILAFYLMSVGISLLVNDQYFIWPPYLEAVLNDDIVGFMAILDSALLFYWAGTDSQSTVLNRIMLLIAGGFIIALTLLELGHAIYVGLPRMYAKAASDFTMFLLVQYIARASNTK